MELRVFLQDSGALGRNSQLALENALFHQIAAAGQVGGNGGHVHGLDVVLLYELRLLFGRVLNDLEQLQIHGSQTVLGHTLLLGRKGGQRGQTLFGDGEGVELRAAETGAHQIAALIQLLHSLARRLGVHAQSIGQISHIAVARPQHLQNAQLKLPQGNVGAVGSGRDPLPVLPTIIFGGAHEGEEHGGHKGDHQAQGSQIDIAAHVKDTHQLQNGENGHGDHAAESAAQRTLGVETGPDGAQAQQNGGGDQPAVCESEEVGGAAGELAEHEGDDANQEHDNLGHGQALLGVGVGIDDALVDVAVGHGGRAQSGGGGGGDGSGHRADHHQRAKQGDKGGGDKAVGTGGRNGPAVQGQRVGVEGTHVAADEAQGDHEHDQQDKGGGDKGLAGHLLTAAVGDLHPVVVIAPHQGGGKADDKVEQGGIGEGHSGHGAGEAVVGKGAGSPVGQDHIDPAEAVGQKEKHGGNHHDADGDLEQVGDGGGPQAGDKGKDNDDQEDDGGDQGAVPAGEGGDVVHAGDNVVGHDAAHTNYGGDGHNRAGGAVIAHFQELRQSLGAAAADKVGVEQAEQQQAAHGVYHAPGHTAEQTVLDGKAGGQRNGGTGKADGAHAHCVNERGDLAASQNEVVGLLDPALAEQTGADQDAAENHEDNNKNCVSTHLGSPRVTDSEWPRHGTSRRWRP